MNFTLHTSFPGELESDWNLLLDEAVTHVPFLRYEYLESWWQTRGGGEWPADARLVIVSARDENGKLAGVAPLFLAQRNGVPTLLVLGTIEVSDYLDLIVRPQDLGAFVEGLLPFLLELRGQGCDWQVFDVDNLIDSSPTIPALQAAAGRLGWNAAVEPLLHSPYIPLPGDWDAYLSGIDKKQRHEVRRKMRRLETAEIPWKWYIVQDLDNIDREVEIFMDLMAQDPDKARFLTPPMREHMKLTAHCAMQAGCLNLSFLEIDGKKAAAYFAFDYLNRLWLYNSGLDRSFNEYSPGWVLLGHLLKWANEHDVSEFDFMRGDEDYKYRFGGVDRMVMRVSLKP